jgi:hypothetical protein
MSTKHLFQIWEGPRSAFEIMCNILKKEEFQIWEGPRSAFEKVRKKQRKRYATRTLVHLTFCSALLHGTHQLDSLSTAASKTSRTAPSFFAMLFIGSHSSSNGNMLVVKSRSATASGKLAVFFEPVGHGNVRSALKW